MILVIGRAERYSPNSVERDAAILHRVGDELKRRGIGICCIGESDLSACPEADAYVSMGRNERTLSLLAEREAMGAVVVNATEAVRLCCDRARLNEVLRLNGVPTAPDEGPDGYWLKRAHGVSEGPMDVQFAASAAEIDRVRATMRRHGIYEVTISAHVKGDLVKFYGVRRTPFFRFYYPGDDRQWKFSDEMRNGQPQHHRFDTRMLMAIADKAASAAGIDVYGGDAIVRADGSICIIDLNDWPSFSRCRNEAAVAIAEVIMAKMELKTGVLQTSEQQLELKA